MKAEKVFVAISFLALLVISVLAGNPEESKGSFSLVPEAGQPVTLIAPADQDLDGAVTELSGYLKRITGREFPVVRNLKEPRDPAGGEKAVPRNVLPLRETFP